MTADIGALLASLSPSARRDEYAASRLDAIGWVALRHDGAPCFLLEEASSGDPRLALRLRSVSVWRHVRVKILSEPESREVVAAVLQCESEDPYVRDLFLQILDLTAGRLLSNHSADQLEQVLTDLRDLFARVETPGVADLVGLWGELLTIVEARAPAVLIGAWHPENSDPFDFISGGHALEVKATQRRERIHRFTSRQLSEPPKILVVSYVLIPSDDGPSVSNLLAEAVGLARSSDEKLKVERVSLSEIGDRVAVADRVRFDRESAMAQRVVVLAPDMPRLLPPFPDRVSNVVFDVLLEGLLTTPASLLGEAEIWMSL